MPRPVEFRTAHGHPKHYVASDHISSPVYRVFTPEILFDIVSQYRLQFDHTSQTGVVLHLMSAVGSRGFLGVTAIGNSPEGAQAIYREFVNVLDTEAQKALSSLAFERW